LLYNFLIKYYTIYQSKYQDRNFAKRAEKRYLSLNINVSAWVEDLEKKGRNSFSLLQLEEELPDCSEIAIKSALKRLSKKGKIVSIHKGFYLIISAPYANRGILPAALFMDSFMNYLQRPYHVGLLSAAALYGAAHQQPQEYFVI